MTQVTANFETGTNGNNLSAGDPGSATAFDSVDTSGGLKYDNTHAYDTLACQVGPSAASAATFTWSTALGGPLTDMYGRLYVYPTAYPAVFYALTQVTGVSIRLGLLANGIGGATADGQMQVLTIDGSSVSTNAVALNQWSRIEFRIFCNASTGIFEVKLFSNAGSATPTETVTRSSANTGTGVSSFDFGAQSGGSSATYWLDNVVFGATSYPGPVVDPAATLQVLSMQRHISGSQFW